MERITGVVNIHPSITRLQFHITHLRSTQAQNVFTRSRVNQEIWWRSAVTWRLCTTTLRVVTIFVTNTTVTCDFKQVNLSSDRVASFHCIRSTNVSSEELLAAEVTQNWHFPKVQCPSAVFRTRRALLLHLKMHRGSSSHLLMLYGVNVGTNKIEC